MGRVPLLHPVKANAANQRRTKKNLASPNQWKKLQVSPADNLEKQQEIACQTKGPFVTKRSFSSYQKNGKIIQNDIDLLENDFFPSFFCKLGPIFPAK